MDIDHIIVGGGIAGITIAMQLLERGEEFLLIESTDRLGGKIETKITDKACFEFGPNSFTNQTEEIFELLRQLDLSEEILEPSPAARNRFILRNGKIVCLPSKPPDILTTKSLSLMGRLRFLREFFYVPKKRVEDESVHEFFERHFGREIADYFADPFVSGIYAGDATELSLKEAFPTMVEAERQSSSLLRYMISQRKTDKATPQTYQLKRGLESIFHRAAEKMGPERIRLSEPLAQVLPDGNRLKVATEKAIYTCKRLYLTIPAYAAAPCLAKAFPELSKALKEVSYAPVVTAHLRISRKEAYPFDGFGILIPSSEHRKILGVLWNSSTFFSQFADTQYHYLTVFVGGVRRAKLVEEDETVLQELICREVQDLFSLQEGPQLIHLRRHAQAIPQYVIGYGKILEAIEKAAHPGLKLSGNYLGGISLPKTITHAWNVSHEGLSARKDSRC